MMIFRTFSAFRNRLFMSFVHLHTHTHYTFQRALGDPEKLAKRAKVLEQSAIAITDAGNLYGAFEFYRACKDI